ncbi:SMODS domain-containing nucleotidyltransferase [Phyllobacterium sp. 22229]|uniref:SMODS domain-containing nucleotidyltransferase n=1 Tax=Phyllobacterium sp. 22229 TaxID=3453895 RepID=UPI003F82F4F4
MTVNSYLTSRASAAVLSADEKTSINTSVSTLGSRLNGYFTKTGDGLSSHFKFGSFTRGTILPRKMDVHSDIDYMVVFEKGGFKPQTYLDRLRTFAESRYSTSELYQSSPTVVLQLNHIKFELVPALFSWGTTYQIANGPNDWQYTNPNDFNGSLEQANGANLYMIKPTIRLVKYWNARAGYVFDSFLLEKWIISLNYLWCTTQRDYLFQVFDMMTPNQATQWRNDRINRAKEIVKNVRNYEAENMPITAEGEVKKLIPE